MGHIFKQGARDDVRPHANAYRRAYDSGHEARCKNAEEAVNYTMGKQWDAEVEKARTEAKKPTLTINKTLAVVAAVYGEYDSMASDVTLTSVTDAGDLMQATLAKAIKYTLDTARYGQKRDAQALTSLTTGQAYLRMRISTDVDPQGEVAIERMNSSSVVLSPDIEEYDPDTWPEVFYYDWLSEEELEQEYGAGVLTHIGASPEDYKEDVWRYRNSVGQDNQARNWDWEQDEKEYRVITREYRAMRDVWVFSNPSNSEFKVVPRDQMKRAAAKRMAAQSHTRLIASKQSNVRIAVWCGDYLISDEWSPYEHFTIYPMFCYFLEGRLMGIVENIKSIQDQINLGESQELNAAQSVTSGGWKVEENSLANMDEEELGRRGSDQGLVLVYRKGYSEPEKIRPENVPPAISSIGVKASNNLREVAGINEAMLGHMPNSAAGKLAEHKRAAGQTLLQWPIKNMLLAEEFVVRGVLSIIQRFYTEQRVLRIKGEDGETNEELPLNVVREDGTKFNDVSVGRFDVKMVRKPRQDAVEDYEFIELLRMREAGAEIPMWMLVEKSHLSNKKELVAELRRAAGLDKTEQEQQLAEAMQQMQLQELQIALELKKQELLKLQAETAKIQASTFDILRGQNERLLQQHTHEKELEGMNVSLRTALSQASGADAITRQLLANSHGKDIARMQGENSLLQTLLSESAKQVGAADKARTTPEEMENE